MRVEIKHAVTEAFWGETHVVDGDIALATHPRLRYKLEFEGFDEVKVGQSNAFPLPLIDLARLNNNAEGRRAQGLGILRQ